MTYYQIIDHGYIVGFGTNGNGETITETEYNTLITTFANRPTPPNGYGYKLKTDMTWELAKIEPSFEDLTNEEALTYYINEQTGANDPDLVSAAETLIKNTITED